MKRLLRNSVFYVLITAGLFLAAYYIIAARGAAPAFTPVDEMRTLFGNAAATQADNPELKAAFRKDVASFTNYGMGIPESFFESRYDSLSPELMLDVLNENKQCHVEAHNLGRVIYKHTHDLVSSLQICQNKCTEGCIHGALMALFNAPQDAGDPSAQSLTPELQRTIAATCDNRSITRYTGVGNCYHALGHVIDALVEGDTSAAIGLCRSVFESVGPGATFFCATGVYMQEDLLFGGRDAKKDNRLYPCDDSLYPAACYRFKLYHLFTLPGEYASAAALCLSLSGDQEAGCFNGLGTDGYWMIRDNPVSLNQLCGFGDATDKRMCVEGALGLLNVYSPGTAQRACELYLGDAAMCDTAARLSNFSMNRDFQLYVR